MNNIKRNLTGIYIAFDKLEGEEKSEPTCFEDCKEETQNAWLDSLTREELVNLVKKLAKTVKDIGDEFDIICN